MTLFFAFLIALCFSLKVFAIIKVDPKSHSFVDTFKRNLIFHGVNAVYKIPPYYPTTTGFDSTSTLSDIDAANLKSWGFNIVRLGVMWPGLEPKERGVYSSSYLDEMEKIVKILGDKGIYVILDLHQDLFHRKFCGEGVPDYVYESCKKSEPSDVKAFPSPVTNETYPIDAEGNPELSSCLSRGFASYYLTEEVGLAFQCLYDNHDSLWDAMAGYWTTVAGRFKSFENVLGYELLNEPWAGDMVNSPKSLIPHYTESKFLQPLYQYLHSKIRQVDDEKIIFFEGLTIDYWPNGFTAAPGDASYNDRQVLAYHIYCPMDKTTPKMQLLCTTIDDEFFAMRRKDSSRLGVGLVMTEFGAIQDNRPDLVMLESQAGLMDKYQQSWMYWQFKYYQDITTCTPEGESLYDANGEPSADKLKVLSRTYPQAVAGVIESYDYQVLTKHFTMTFFPRGADEFQELSKGSTGLRSEIYVNRVTDNKVHGLKVTVTGDAASAVSIQCPSLVTTRDREMLWITQTAAAADGAKVSIEIAPCVDLTQSCTCI